MAEVLGTLASFGAAGTNVFGETLSAREIDLAGRYTKLGVGTFGAFPLGFYTNGVQRIQVTAAGAVIARLPTHADEAAAVTAGLATGTLYRTATGEVRIKL